MMFKIVKRIIIIILICILTLPSTFIRAVEQGNYILIIYDTYQEYAGKTNNLDELVKIVLTSGNNIEIRNLNSYTDSDLYNAKGIIVLSNEEGTIEKEQQELIYSYEEKLLWIGKNSSRVGTIPLDFSKDSALSKINKAICEKFSAAGGTGGKTYLLLDEVYPYDDLNLLVEKADYLYENGIPFLVEAMGVYENKDSDAMKRYTEALRYCVSKGGTIIYGNPVIYNLSVTEEKLIKEVQIGTDNFVNHQVYPIGSTINQTWLYQNNRKDYLSKTSTIVIEKNADVGVLNFDSHSIGGFDNVIIKVSQEEFNKEARAYNNIAISMVANEPMDLFKNKIKQSREKKIKFYDAKTLNCKFNFGSNSIENSQQGLYVNGNDKSGNGFISNKELFAQTNPGNDPVEDKVGVDLTKFNYYIAIITAIGAIIFIIFFITSIKIDRRKYFK